VVFLVSSSLRIGFLPLPPPPPPPPPPKLAGTTQTERAALGPTQAPSQGGTQGPPTQGVASAAVGMERMRTSSADSTVNGDTDDGEPPPVSQGGEPPTVSPGETPDTRGGGSSADSTANGDTDDGEPPPVSQGG